MRQAWLTAALGLGMLGCAVRYPKIIAVREEQFRSHDAAVALPLTVETRGEVSHFLEFGGNRLGRNAVPDEQGETHRQALDALGVAANLAVRSDLATADFCAMAAPLCAAAPLFQKRVAITQVIDARNRAPEVPEPIGVCDDEYCWVFHHENQRLTQLVVMRSTQRAKP
ncbi:MAG: hypothetical protein ABI759_21560 [Candidatus Solibacter sp.]